MENEDIMQSDAQADAGYTPRPAWQVWGARAGALFVAVCFLLYLLQIAGGGL